MDRLAICVDTQRLLLMKWNVAFVAFKIRFNEIRDNVSRVSYFLCIQKFPSLVFLP